MVNKWFRTKVRTNERGRPVANESGTKSCHQARVSVCPPRSIRSILHTRGMLSFHHTPTHILSSFVRHLFPTRSATPLATF